MKKLILSAVMICLLIVIVWGVTVWYLGERSELEFKNAVLNNTQMAGEKLFRAELLSYRKTLLGAKASLRISSDIAMINERMGDLLIEAELLNGPLFIEKSGVSIGSARWVLKIDEENLAPEVLENLYGLFENSLPTATIRIDFDKKAHYWGRADSIVFQSIITGLYDLETEGNRGSILIDKVTYGAVPNQITAEKIKISYQHQKAITSNYKPGTTSILIPGLKINHKDLQTPLSFSLKSNSNIYSKNNYLNGFIKVNLINNTSSQTTQESPFNNAEISLLFKGVSSNGFIGLSEAKAEIDNLRQQTQWVLQENGELPEGQDQIWQLYDQIDILSKQLPQLLINEVFDPEKLKIAFEIKAHNNSGTSSLVGDLKFTDKTTTSTDLMSFLKAQAQVNLDKDLFEFLSEFTDINKQNFILRYEDNKFSENTE